MIKILIFVFAVISFHSQIIYSQPENLPTQSNLFIKISDEMLKASTEYQIDNRTMLSKLNEVNLEYPESFVGFVALRLYNEFLHNGLDINITRLHKSQIVMISFTYEYIKWRVPELMQDYNAEKYLTEKFPDINESQINTIIDLLKDKSLEEKYIQSKFLEEFEILKNPIPPQPINLKEALSELIYPENARKSKIEDKVVITIIVDKQGNFEKISSYEGNLIFEDEVKKLAKKLKFKPGMIFGEPAIMSIKIPVNFKLSNK